MHRSQGSHGGAACHLRVSAEDPRCAVRPDPLLDGHMGQPRGACAHSDQLVARAALRRLDRIEPEALSLRGADRKVAAIARNGERVEIFCRRERRSGAQDGDLDMCARIDVGLQFLRECNKGFEN